MSFRIVERVFSDDEACPTVMLANIYGSPNVKNNLSKMEQIIEVAHRKKVNILVFPELLPECRAEYLRGANRRQKNLFSHTAHLLFQLIHKEYQKLHQ